MTYTSNYLNKIILCVATISISLQASAQGVYVPVGDKDYYHIIDRIDILRPSEYSLHTSSKPFDRRLIGQLVDSTYTDKSVDLSNIDYHNLDYIANNDIEWSKIAAATSGRPIFNTFYKNKADLYHVATKDFDLHVNPVLQLGIGKDNNLSSNLLLNTRGVEIRGMISKKVGFYSYLADNQAILPLYVQTYNNFNNILGVPGEGYTKPYKQGGVDFITARGYFTFSPVKHIQVQFGHDKHFIGNGYRSLILSDFSSNYTFLKLDVNVWKINYSNIFAELTGDVFYQNALLPKKYFAFHHLSVNLTKNINVGLFESIIFSRRDSLNNGGFDFNYMNPIIFYRSAEIQQGSQDNALLGMDYKINFLKRFSLYGQYVLDEFVFTQVIKNDGYYGNKYAAQIGLKYINAFGIKNLDAQGELNMVRPYVYSHRDIYRNYANYRMPMAHPLGANFYEAVGILRYQPFKRLTAVGKLIYSKYGADTSYSSTSGYDNFGGNVMKDYGTASAIRPMGNTLGQGISTQLFFMSLNVSYMVRHNLYIDFTQVIRKLDSAIDSRDLNTTATMIGVRWNIPQRLHEF